MMLVDMFYEGIDKCFLGVYKKFIGITVTHMVPKTHYTQNNT